MIRITGFPLSRIGPALLLLASTSAIAQTEVAPPPTPFADRLAEQMRVLATQPTNVPALLIAAEMSARLDDADAARDFLARAEAASPGDPRAEAVRARMLVRGQRPGEALRLFADAERRGVDVRSFVDDRGFAYDLLGAPEAAQRDYRLALSGQPSDEVSRRLALSLGISGKRDEAMTVLDPLLRRIDRAAWRARAFILALTGDAEGAERIAGSMMPNGMGSALTPFFARLPKLSQADQAFAVHFGELARTPARVADARLAPPLPVIERPVQLASANTSSAARVPDRRSRRQRERDERQLQAERDRAQSRRNRRGETAVQPVVVAARAATPQAAPLPPPPSTPAPVQFAQAAPVVQAVPQPPASAVVTQQPAPAPIDAPVGAAPQPEATRVAEAQVPRSAPGAPSVGSNSVPAEPIRSTAASSIVLPAAEQRAAAVPTPTPPLAVQAAPAPAPAAQPAVVPVPQSSATSTTAVAGATTRSVPLPQDPDATAVRNTGVDVNAPVPAAQPAGVPATTASVEVALAEPSPAPQTIVEAQQAAGGAQAGPQVAAAPVASSPAPISQGSEQPTPPLAPSKEAQADEVLAAIVRNITIPAAELGVGSPERAPPQEVASAVSAPAPVQPAPRPKPALAKPEVKPEAKPKPEAKSAKPDPKAAAKPPAKKEAPKPDPKKQEPARWWAQVAGGADVKALPKEWKKLVDKAPDTLKGRSPWTTPLRFTNRLLVGPFKSEAEAQSFVNGANKKGLSSFAWQSEAGQKIDKLPLK